jgi:predicted membrane-bound mannosyltransferase
MRRDIFAFSDIGMLTLFLIVLPKDKCRIQYKYFSKKSLGIHKSICKKRIIYFIFFLFLITHLYKFYAEFKNPLTFSQI